MIKNSIAIQHIKAISEIFPVPIYWIDINSVVLGANRHTLDAVGASVFEEVIGKTPFDFYPTEIADRISKRIDEVIRTGQMLSQEEPIIDISTGQQRYFKSYRSPLFDDDGAIIGVLVMAIETTADKEAELLRLEYKKEQDRYKKAVDQVAHDIRSPLASLLMILKACPAIPEKERVALREAAITIGDIANNLVNNSRKKDSDQDAGTDRRESVLVSPVLLQVLAEKKYQYQNLAVKMDYQIEPDGYFAWVFIDPTSFKRMLSNIINNAVDAFKHKQGNVTVYLDADDVDVRITIEDDGNGMPRDQIQKIVNRAVVAEGKPDGEGIGNGLTQVRDTVESNDGHWEIVSQLEIGTEVRLIFPRAKPLNWIAQAMQLDDDDTVVILDDESSIHMAWDFRFASILKKHPGLTLKHFEIGRDTVAYINGLTPEKKKKIFLLADYELLKQDLNGLNVIEAVGVDRAILVTSHYANKTVQKSALKIGTKILPKQLASDIPIHVNRVDQASEPYANSSMRTDSDYKKVDVIFVDDEQNLLDSFRMFADGKKVETYRDPHNFMQSVDQYSRQTKIMLDQHFANSEIKGSQLAEKLHAMGFNQLYLLTGGNYSDYHIQDYLTVILKTDLDILAALLNEK